MKKTLFIVFALLFQNLIQCIFGQIPVGTWRDHFSYIQATAVVKANNKIFCSTPYALFYYNLDDNSIEKLSRTNGLSDIGVSSIAFDDASQLLIVAYQNANLDFIKGNTIYNLPDIKNKQIQGSKRINQIVFLGNLAYLACGFGIVVIDIDKKEVKDTYYIGPNASSLEVYNIAFDDKYIYAATISGIYYALKSSSTLANYNEWSKINSIAFPNGKYTSIINLNSTLLVNYNNPSGSSSIIYKQNGANWSELYNDPKLITKLTSSDDHLLLIEDKAVKVFTSNFIKESEISDYGFAGAEPFDAYYSSEGQIYIADKFYGLVVGNKNEPYKSIKPNGPFNNNVADIDIQNGKTWIASGGKTSSWLGLGNTAAAYSFINETWNSTILWGTNALDFVKILVNPVNPSQVFAAAWGAGLYEFSNAELVQSYNATNSTLQSIIAGEDYIRIGGLLLDQSQNLYMTNTAVSSPISVKTYDGKWYSYNYSGLSGYGHIGEIVETTEGDKWVQLAKGGGLFVFNDNSTFSNQDDDKYRQFSLFDQEGAVVTNEVLSLAVDQDDVVWVGTDQGVFTYYNPQNVFDVVGHNFYAERIKVVNINPDTVIQFLLTKEKITSIAIDGANRKWFGTESSGAYLMSADCQKEILHFTKENSKLISNTIVAIDVDGKSGEVFFGTNMGLVSFKSTATKGDDSFKGAYVYPNPVRENYTGPITITGLAANVNVKITDISGQLVYETTAFGGEAIWNGNNYTGKRVNTGVYMVFCTDEKGDKTKVLKLLVIH